MKKLLCGYILVLCLLYIPSAYGQPTMPDTEEQACITYIPKAISPNGDGINDHFEVRHVCNLESYSLEIYSLSNKLVHSSKDLAFSWDGSVSGRPAPEGRYSWVMSYKREDGNRVRLEGEVVLVR